jgi:cytosine/adenosine deaminase-related metal-dependent hydrolase
LPPVDELNKHARNICIGTDSLASNDKLNILGELIVLSRTSPSIPFDTLIKWGTINGARALNMQSNLGSITKGKTPGLNLLQNINPEEPFLDGNTTLRKIQ